MKNVLRAGRKAVFTHRTERPPRNSAFLKCHGDSGGKLMYGKVIFHLKICQNFLGAPPPNHRGFLEHYFNQLSPWEIYFIMIWLSSSRNIETYLFRKKFDDIAFSKKNQYHSAFMKRFKDIMSSWKSSITYFWHPSD